MASTRARQLEKLAANLPGANQQVQQGLAEARQTQLQETVRRAGPSAGTRAAQQLGAQQTAAAGQAGLQGLQQQQGQQVQLGQLGLQEASRGQRERAGEQQLVLSQRQREMADKLSLVGRQYKNELLDEQLTFQRDQAGTALFNERQLMDWAVTKAESREDLMEYMQVAEQAHERKLKLLEHTHKLLQQTLQQGYIKKNQPLDQETKKIIQQRMNDTEQAISQAQAQAANTLARNQAIAGTLGAVAGGIGGFMIGGPVGAAAGASAGASIGTGVGSL